VNRIRTIAVTVIAGLVLVACGPAASGSAEPEPGGAASQAASQGAQASQGGPAPSFSAGVVADLEALIPDTVGDLTINKTSMRGNEFLVSPDSDPAMVQFLQDVGVSPDDLSIAIGFGFSADASVAMFVFRAAGADSNTLLNAWKQVTDADAETPIEWASATVGGKQVETTDQGGGTTYLYVKNDLLVFLSTSDPATAEEIIGGLP